MYADASARSSVAEDNAAARGGCARQRLATLALAISSPLVVLLAERFAYLDWWHCLWTSDGSPRLAVPQPHSLSVGLADLILAAIPFVLPALAALLARRKSLRRAMRGAIVLLMLIPLWTIADPSTAHDCDRKGPDMGLLLMIAMSPILTFLAAFVSLFSDEGTS